MAQRTLKGAIVSSFGDITPAFAAAFGASVDVALPLAARNAEARAVSRAAREQQRMSRREVLAVEIATAQALPASRVGVGTNSGPARRFRLL